jgi:ribosomal protein L3 glutamine methyltransferase
MTLIAFIEHWAARLQQAGVSFGHGTDNAFDEAVWLSLWSLGLPLHDLDSVAQRELSAQEQTKAENLMQERISTRKPAAYLTRQAWLQGVPFYVDERAIVPRSFIAELLADGLIDSWLTDQTHQVLDLCTGNGSLAVLAAMAYPDVQVTGSDLSADALEVARINVAKHSLEQRITLVQGATFAAVKGQRFDLILCNPPYVNAQSMAALPPEYQAEPEMALASGVDGMDFTRELLRHAADHMTDNAVLVLEIGNERENFERAFPDLPVCWLETSAGMDQVLLIEHDDLLTYTQR